MRIRQGQRITFDVDLKSDPFCDYDGKSYADITEIACNLKKRPEIDEDDQYCQSLYSRGQITIDEPNHTFKVTFDQDQTIDIPKGTYTIVFAVRLDGIRYMIEYEFDDNEMTIKADRNRA